MDRAPPAYLHPQSRIGDEAVRTHLAGKIDKLESRGYLETGEALSLLNHFAVPKGDADIRTVFDGTKSGLNDALFANWFPLPQVKAMTCCLEVGYYFADNNVGEQFYNFWLHPMLQSYCGVDWRPIRGKDALVLLWLLLIMGFKPSPYQAVRDNRRAKYIVLGDPSREGNPFGWVSVELNLPGTKDYKPSRPWVSKHTKEDHVSCMALDYMDDNRTTGHDYESTWLASSTLAKEYTNLGIQDANRKWRSPSVLPGPRAGAIVCTEGVITKSVSQEHWDKTKRLVSGFRVEFDHHSSRPMESPGLDRNQLERVRGYSHFRGEGLRISKALSERDSLDHPTAGARIAMTDGGSSISRKSGFPRKLGFLLGIWSPRHSYLQLGGTEWIWWLWNIS